MSVKAKLTECLHEVKRADYSGDDAARRSYVATSRLLALVWEAALGGAAFSERERGELRPLLLAAAPALRAHVERVCCTFRTGLDDVVLRERSSLQFLLENFGCDTQLRQAGLDESTALLDSVISRWRNVSDDSDDEAKEPRPRQPHVGVPRNHTWWLLS